MATVAQIQAQLDPSATGRVANIIQSVRIDATYDSFLVVGMTSAPGRTRWIRTTNAHTAAQQATDILAGLRAS